MKELGDIELQRKAVLKAWRSLIRLKHSLKADAEINSALPRAEKAFDAAVHRGVLPSAEDVVEALAVTPDA